MNGNADNEIELQRRIMNMEPDIKVRDKRLHPAFTTSELNAIYSYVVSKFGRCRGGQIPAAKWLREIALREIGYEKNGGTK